MPWDDYDDEGLTIKWKIRRPIFTGEMVLWAEGEATAVTIVQKHNRKYGCIATFPRGFDPELDIVTYEDLPV